MAEAQEQPQAGPQPESAVEEPARPAHPRQHGLSNQDVSSPGKDPLLDQPPEANPAAQVQTSPQTHIRVETQAQAHDRDQQAQSHRTQEEPRQKELPQQLRPEEAAEAHTKPLQRAPEDIGTEGIKPEAPQAQVSSSANAVSSASTTPSTVAPTTVATDISSSAVANGTPAEHSQPNGSAPLSPSSAAMSNPSHHSGHPRAPVSYPNQPYAPAAMDAPYGYQNSVGQPADAYRGNPSLGNGPMSLPSMRTFDPIQQQQQQQQQIHMAAPGSQQMNMTYYAPPVPGVPLAGNPYGLPSDPMGPRYALPSSDPRNVLASGRHSKKEIKRRTKTGCLTCRKRRIKCDEQHPFCKNCTKSKRECAGYDPIFKNSPQHPTNIQPAPNQTNPPSSLPSNGPLTTTPSVPSNTAAYNSVSSVPSSNVKNHPVLEYSSAIDPALDCVVPTSSTWTSQFPATNPPAPIALDQKTLNTPHLRGGGSDLSFSPLHSSVSHNALSHQSRAPAYSGFSARKMKVDELVALGGVTPTPLQAPPSQAILDDISNCYKEIYGPGLESFFESKWFVRPEAANIVLANKAVTELMASFLLTTDSADPNNRAATQYLASLEFRIVWDLTCLARTAEAKTNTGPSLPTEDDPIEIRNRIAVLETLLSGDCLEQNPLWCPAQAQAQNDESFYHRLVEHDFWHTLGEFLRINDEPNVDMTAQRDSALSKMRNLLGGRENRDVLYSIAVMRALTPNYSPGFESTLPPHLDESDPKSKLAVARKFIQNEAMVTGGTTNVVRRYAELAERAFIVPGANVPRRSTAV